MTFSIVRTLRVRACPRPSLTFFRATVGELEALHRHLGLAPAEVESDVGPDRGDYELRFPESRSVADRTLRQLRRGVRIVLGYSEHGSAMTLSVGDTIGGKLDTALNTWGLTPRQSQVLRSLV